MKQNTKNNMNKLRELANEQRKILDEMGRPDLGVIVTNMSHEYEKMIKDIGKRK